MALVIAAVLAVAQVVSAAATVTLTTLDVRWSVPFETPPAASAGFDARTAYVPLKGGQLVAVDLDLGTVRWRVELPTALTPATGDGLVFVAGEQQILALDAQTGKERWRTALPGGAAAPLYWDTGWLIASTPAGDLAAFRASDGSLVWRQTLGSPLSARPGPALDRLYVAVMDGRLLSLSLATGDALWTRTVPGHVTGLVALDDQVVFGTSSRDVQSVDLRTGRERWAWRVGGDVAGVPAADARHIYFASRDNVVRAVDRKSGNLRWRASLASRPAGGPIRVDDLVLVPFVSSEVAVFDPKTGKAGTSITAAGEIGGQPFLRPGVRATSPLFITVTREGQLQGFGLRFEPPPALLDVLPGSLAVP